MRTCHAAVDLGREEALAANSGQAQDAEEEVEAAVLAGQVERRAILRKVLGKVVRLLRQVAEHGLQVEIDRQRRVWRRLRVPQRDAPAAVALADHLHRSMQRSLKHFPAEARRWESFSGAACSGA